jgi:hypothetical protein
MKQIKLIKVCDGQGPGPSWAHTPTTDLHRPPSTATPPTSTDNPQAKKWRDTTITIIGSAKSTNRHTASASAGNKSSRFQVGAGGSSFNYCLMLDALAIGWRGGGDSRRMCDG